MDDRIMQFRVGVVVFATLFIAGILIMMFGKFTPFQETYTFQISFSQAPGVTKDTPVRKSGVLIGRVTDVELTDDAVLVTVNVEERRRLRKSETPRIGGRLFGDAVIEFYPRIDQADDFIEEGDIVQGEVASDPFAVVSRLDARMQGVTESVTRTSDDFGELSRKLSAVIDRNEEKIGSILEKSQTTLGEIENLARNTNQFINDETMQKQVRQAVADLPQLVEDARAATESVKRTMALADRNMANLERFTEPLGDRGVRVIEQADQLISKLNRGAGDLNTVMSNLAIFSRRLNDSNGTLGRLMTDTQLYDNLNAATSNINRLTVELRPVIADARVFSDKIARHPELLGVRGALNGSSGAKPVRRNSQQRTTPFFGGAVFRSP